MKKFLSIINTFIPALFIMLFLVSLQVLLNTVFVLIFHVNTGGSFTPVQSALLNICYGVFAPVVLFLVYKGMDRSESKDTVRMGIRNALLAMLLGICTQFLLESLLQFLYLLTPDFIVFKKYNEFMKDIDGSKTALIYIYTLFLAPITEELAFRGVILLGFRKTFNEITANILQALLFAVLHYQIVQSSYAFIAGLILGYVMCKRNNLFEVIVVHITVNITGTVIMPVLMDVIYMLPMKTVWIFMLLVLSCAGTAVLLKKIKETYIDQAIDKKE